MKNRRLLPIILVSIFLFLCAAIVVSAFWLLNYSKADEKALAALTSTEQIDYSNKDFLSFEPIPNDNNTGIIFYPGGKVDPQAYSPLARDLTLKGNTVIITPMPLNLAVLNVNAGKEVIARYPKIKNWIIAGHSLGGSMAVKFYNQNKIENLKAIILLAAYPDSADNISSSDVKVLSLWGSQDNVINKSLLESTKQLLPSSTVFTEIYGANHSQFGSYGLQSGDNPAGITFEQQQSTTVSDIDNFIQSFNL